MSDTKKSGLNRRANGLMALEPRYMFDGAAITTAVESFGDHDTNLLRIVSDVTKSSASVQEAQQIAAQTVADYLQTPDVLAQLFTLFNGGKTQATPEWTAAANDIVAKLLDQTISLRVQLRSSSELQGALGAFAQVGTDGQPVIYLNSDYVNTASPEAIQAVLLEEIGHAIDAFLNPASDTPGDEGHAFASLLLNGPNNAMPAGTENDHANLILSGQSVAVETAAPYAIAQVHFVPIPEGNLQTAQQAISSSVSGLETTVIAITATANNTVIVYDQWEDGYEADINNPTQASTQIWGDGNLTNGVAPGTTNDLIVAGQTILLQNQVNTATPLTVDYDGRDKIGATQAVSVVRAGWSATPGTVLAGAVSVIDSGNAGTDYIVPIGQDVDTVATGTNRLFEYTSLHIIANQDGTTINIDANADGVFELTNISLSQGQTYFVNGGVMAGAHITSNKGIGVYSVAGDVGSAYENRWFALTPTEQWASSYYAPVSTTLAADPSYVILYNPNGSAIDVYYDTATTTGTKVTVGANTSTTTGTNYVLMPASAAHFYTKDGSKFFAVGVVDADATSNATHDWSYSLVPESYLTTKFVVGWGPGYDLTTSGTSFLNGSPVWVTATDDTTIYIDNAAGIQVKNAAGTLVTGTQVGSTSTYAFNVLALQSYRVFDTTDKNQSGLTVYTDDGTLITAAWGEDPSIAGAGTPYLDMGTTVLPFPDYVFSKTSVEASPVTYAGASDGDTNVELGEQIEYTLSVTNRAIIDLFNINVKDAINSASAGAATYVANSTTIKIVRADGTVALDTTAIADDVSGSPLDLTGFTLTDADPTTVGTQGLKRGDQLIVKYRVQVSSSIAALANAGFVITNDAEMTGSPAGTTTPITRNVSNQTIVNVNGTSDGQIFIKNSTFTSSTSTFAEGATVGLEVVDNDANRSTTAINTLSVTVTNANTGETENVTLTETGVNTGTFRGTLATSNANGDSANNSGTLQFRAGDTIRADYTDPLYGVAFDNPSNPGVSGDSDGNIATGNANSVTASIAVPSQTKILYFSDDSTNNLDRNLPPVSDTTAATTGQLVTSIGTFVSITDDFGTGSSFSASTGTGWNGAWTKVNDANAFSTGNDNVRVSDQDPSNSVTNWAMYIRSASTGISRNFAALGSSATLTFDLKNYSSKPFESTDYIAVLQYVSGAWAEVGRVLGSDINTSNFTTQSMTLSSGATGLRFVTSASNDSNDRVYLDNVKISTGGVSLGNSTGTTDFALSASASAGQSFTLANSGASADSIAIDQLTLSLKKTGTTPATATVSIRNSWDGAVLWSTTVSTSQLSTSYQDFALTPTGLTLDKSGTYVIRVDSNASGVVWQGNTTSSFADGTRISSSGTAVSASDLRFFVKGHETGMTSVSFSQGLTMATDFTLPVGGIVKVVTYVTNETDLTGDAIKAELFDNGTSFAVSSSPVYNSTNHTLTWSFSALGASKTILAGHAVTLKITNNSTTSADHFQIAYDSYATPSRIEFPTSTVINFVDADPVTAGVQEVGFFDNTFANGGSPITSGFANAGAIVYVRFKVADPFGDYDISSLALTIDGPGSTGDISINLADAKVVDSASDGRAYKTYEYAWQTVYNVGNYTIGVVANEGTEGTVTDTATSSLLVSETDLGTPSVTMFRTQLAASSGTEAGAIYDTSARAYVRVTDLDKSGSGSVSATISNGSTSYVVTLTEIGTSGIFEADLGNSAVHSGAGAAAAATYFATLPNGASLTATYTDATDSSDSSSDAILVNSAPTAVVNSQSIGIDKQATGNVITDDNNGNTAGGVDTDPNASQTLVVTQVNGSSANLGDTITLASGARLLVKADGSYIYDPSSLTSQPTSGSPVTDSFTYTISDGQGGTSTATVTLTVVYIDPIVIDNQSNTDGAAIEFDVSNKFADLAATYDLVYSIASGNPLPAGLSIDANTGIISGTISATDSTSAGSHAYTVGVTVTKYDDTGAVVTPSVTRSFSWTITNVAPDAVNDSGSTRQGQAFTGNVLSNDSDGAPDSDTLTVSQFTVNGSTYSASSTSRTIAGVGAIVINTNGSYTFTPLSSYQGGSVPSITYTITDGNSGTDTATLDLRVIGINDVAVNEGSPYAVFEVTGVANEQVSLALSNGTAAIDSNGTPVLDGSEDFGPSIQYSTDSGVSWGNYNSSPVALNGNGKLLVRTLVINDTLYEGAQNFTLRATNSLNSYVDGTATLYDDGTGQWFDGTSGTGSATAPVGSTLNDDRPAFSINDVTVNEAAGTMTFTVTKTGSTALASSVQYATADDTAIAGSDYTATNGTLNFAAGDASKTFTVSITNDAVYEGAEAFKVNLTSASGAVISDSQGVGTIKDDGTGNSSNGGSGTGTDDDRPAFSINDVTVNEAAGTMTFTVTKTGSTALASSVQYATADDTAIAGSDYTATNGTLNFAAGDTSKTFTVSITNDAVYEGAEAFKVNLTSASGAVISDSQGVGTIKDDGTGNSSNGGSGTGTNDDRTLSVNTITLNEGSPYGVFTVSAIAGETLTLALANASAINNSANRTALDGSVDFGPALQYASNGGTTWTTYSGAFTVPGTGAAAATLLVRTAVINDTVYEGAQDFTLSAAYTSGASRSTSGTGTIYDDGTGQWFDGTSGTGSATAPVGSTLNDDRSLNVTGGVYNEGSPRALFTITANAGQVLTLDVQNAAQAGGKPTGGNEGKANDSLDNAPIYVSLDGGATWQLYTGPLTAGSVPVLVAVDISNEQDDVLEGEEQLKLVVTTGTQSASAYASILDDGQGMVLQTIDATTRNNNGLVDASATQDDDRPKASVTLPSLTLAEPASKSSEAPVSSTPVSTVPAFTSALQPSVLSKAATPEPALNIADVKTSSSGYQIPVTDSAPPGLTVYRGVTDQFVQGTEAAVKVSLPFDAFIHSNKDAVIKLQAKQSDDSPLPKWVQFDPASGVFEVTPPKGFKGKLDVKVVARDDEGREVTAMFQLFVSEPSTAPVDGRPQGRNSFSEQLRFASKRSAYLVKVAEAGPHKQSAHESRTVKARMG